MPSSSQEHISSRAAIAHLLNKQDYNRRPINYLAIIIDKEPENGKYSSWHLLSDDECILVVRPKEVVAPVGLSCLSSVFANIENSCVDSNPIEITRQFLCDICLASSGQTDHCDHMRDVDVSGRPVA